MVSETLLEKVRRKCYITDTSELTIAKLKDMLEENIPYIKRMIGIVGEFDFEKEENQEELKLLKNYCWYDWNDLSNEFKANYLDDILSLRHKHEVNQYDEEESE